MANKAFIDIAVLDPVRSALLAGRPVIVFDGEVNDVVWANGRASDLFGTGTVSAMMDDGITQFAPARRQVLAAARSSTDLSAVLIRIRTGVTTQLVRANIAAATTPDGDPLIVAVFGADEEGDEDLNAVISGLGDEDAGAAVFDDAGSVLASNTRFDGFGLEDDVLGALAAEVATEDDRLVKRLVAGADNSVAAGIGRLRDGPDARYLFLGLAIEEPATDKVAQDKPAATDFATLAQADEIGALPVAPADMDNDEPPDTPNQVALETSDEFTFEPASGPIRFVWKMDAGSVFTEISPEFTRTVGPAASDILGKSFETISAWLSLDPDGDISASLNRRDTWSGKTVMWPVENTDLRVPVDLAALPYYSRDREFEGYRGFGVIRVADVVIDPDAKGQLLAVDPTTEETVSDDRHVTDMPMVPIDDDPFEGEPPALVSSAINPDRIGEILTHSNDDTPEQVPAEPHSSRLEPREQAAFDEIGKALSDEDTTTTEAVSEEAEQENAPGPQRAEDVPIPVDADITATPEQADQEIASDEDTLVGEPWPLRTSDHTPDNRGLDADMLDGLPLALLIVRDERAIFGNMSFQVMTGYDDIEDLNDAGGLAALIDGPSDHADGIDTGKTVRRPMTLIAADNDRFAARAHMQIVPFEGASALMFAFEPINQDESEDTPYVRDRKLGRIVDDGPVEAKPKPDNVVAFAGRRPGDLDDLKSRVEELESILDIASDGIVILKSDGTIRSINGPGAALFGYDRAELEGKSFSLLFAHESQRAAMDYMYSMTNNGVASILNEGREVLGREQNGGFLPMFMTMGSLPSSDTLCAVMRDITPWKQSEQAMADAKRTAEEASASKSEFLAKISHEIRTPLNAIIGFSELIQEERFGALNNQRYKDYLADINKSGRHVLDLVNDLLDLSKIEAGKQDMNFESVDLNAVTTDAISMVQPQASRSRILMRSSLDPAVPPVVADTRSVRQIVLNLLSNSIRFTHSGGLIVASTSYTPQTGVTLRIKDTGIGMTAKEVDMALQPFQQVAERSSQQSDGTGLGLPLTKALVEANRAEFEIHSEPGRGTIVEILFPENRVLNS